MEDQFMKKLLCAVALLAGTSVFADDDTMKKAGEKVDTAADATKKTTKKAASDTADASKKATSDASTATKKAATKSADATKKAASKADDKVQKATTETAPAK